VREQNEAAQTKIETLPVDDAVATDAFIFGW
jgi:hypothetical protein